LIQLLVALTIAGSAMTIPDNPCPAGWQYIMADVRAGEGTVDAVAGRLRVDAASLAAWNDMAPHSPVDAGRRIFFCRDHRASSVGYAWRGQLRGGVNIDANGDGRGCGWVKAADRVNTWGTSETVASLSDCLCRYRIQHPQAPDISLGDLSRRTGGRLSRHVSHRSGRDVDLGYITNPPQTDGRFSSRASLANLDDEKQWSLLKCFIDRGNVRFIFMSWQALTSLRAYVESVPEFRSYLRYFPRGERPLLVNDPSHKNHIHIRFTCPVGDPNCLDR